MAYKDPEVGKAKVKEWKRNNMIAHTNHSRKTRCKQLGIPFDLTTDYLLMLKEQTPCCCITGETLDYETNVINASNKAHLDRLVPNEGYVKGNVRWISAKANRMKADNNTDSLLTLLADSLRVSRAELDERLAPLISLRDAVEATESTAVYETYEDTDNG